MLQFHKAERRMSKLRLGIAGPAGSGKTYSALLIAFGIGGRVALIDTERGSGELYAHLGEYDVCSITSPFEPEKYTEAVKAAEAAGYGVIIIDSLSHAWSGEGGLLDLHGHLSDRSGNSWAAWRKVTPKHNQLVEAMLQSTCHIIATMRSKMEYTQVTENGKTVVKKLGMNPIQRDGMEYEFTLFLDLDLDHMASAGKDRTSLFDGKFFKPNKETGKSLIRWLEEGKVSEEPAKVERPENEGTCREPKPDAPSKTSEPGANEEKKPAAPKQEPSGGGNGLRFLFARLGSFGISKETYKAYCHRKYNIQSMKEMTPAQREEQIKILNSLKNSDRLEEFKKILAEIGSKPEAKETHEANGKEAVPGAPPADPAQGQAQEFNYF
jgi:hypothetical protein